MYIIFFILNIWKIIEKNFILNNFNLYIYVMGEGVLLIIYFLFIFRLYWNIIIIFKKVNYFGGGGKLGKGGGIVVYEYLCVWFVIVMGVF